GPRGWFVAAAVFAAVMSVQNGLTYNVHLIKSEAYLQGASTSGWMFPLLLPDVDAADRLAQPLTLAWLVGMAALLIVPFAFGRSREPGNMPRRRVAPALIAAIAVLVFGIGASAIG